jgi:hypothetical protein
MKTLIVTLLYVIQVCVFSQSEEQQKLRQQILSKTDTVAARNLIIEFANRYQDSEMELIEWSNRTGYPIRTVGSDGTVTVLHGIMNGRLIYKKTFNRIAAQTTSTNVVWSEYNLDGTGIEIGQWDGGAVYVDHNSFREGPYGQRHVYFVDPPGTGFNDHATHVAGTIVADNDEYYAKGMANEAVLISRDWDDDLTEITNAAYGIDPNLSVPLILSNHSYGNLVGWHWGDLRNVGTNAWYWMAEDYQNEDPWFSDYNQVSFDYDQIAFNFPYYMIVWAAGNDRGEGPEPNAQHWVWNGQNWVTSTSYHPKDGQVTNGFKCLPPDGVAKNLITVGAVDDISYGYQSPADVQQVNTDFSSWGPTKDGRIKPDIVANGDALYSTMPNNLYGSMSGTSMAAPNVTGSLALLLQHYKNTHNNTVPLSSTLKAIVIHTADESGSSLGPDYKYGWGILNTYKAAQLISEDQGNTTAIQELTLQAGTGQSYTLDNLYSEGTQPIKITLAWNDIPPSNYQTGPILMHDLDVRLVKNGTTYYPWKLNPASPNSPAIQSDNTKDNVEQILLQSPGEGYYSVVITHKGNLAFNQMFSLIVTGFVSPFVTFNLKQIGSDGQTFGEAAYWENLMWNYVPPTQPVILSIGENHFISTQNFRPSTYEKFNKWNDNLPETGDWYRNWDIISLSSNTILVSSRFVPTVNDVTVKNDLESTGINGGQVEFMDPWLVDFNEPPYGFRSQGMNAPFLQRTSPFNPNYSSSHKGVFLNQDYNVPGNPYYKVGMPTEQTISINGQNRKFFPYKWTGSGVAFQNEHLRQTGAVFTSSNATATAILKGQLMSNDQNGISSGSQRKLVRTDNGIYHIVYESMGEVWYTHSLTTNFNGAWSQDYSINEGQGQARNPSIDFEGNKIKIVMEFYDPYYWSEAVIFLMTWEPDANGNYYLSDFEDVQYYSPSYLGNAKPVLAYNNSVVFVSYRKNSNDGLYQKTKWNVAGNWQWGNEGLIPNTNSYSSNPSVSGRGNDIYLAWQHSLGIRYIFGYAQSTNWIYNNYAVISTGSGYTNNSSPSISLARNYYPVVSWIGYNYVDDGGGGINKIEGEDAVVSKVVVRRSSSGSWSSFFKAGNNAATTNNNSSSSTVSEQSVITWSEGTAPNYNSKWVRRVDGSYTDVQNLSHNGKQNQASNGTNLENIKGTIFSTTSSPFMLSLSTTNFNQQFIGGGINKGGDLIELSYGREGVIYKNGVEFLFNIGDIIVGDSVIKFIEQPDTILYSSAEELNSVVKTVPFYLSTSTEFYFTDFYYVLNDSLADTALTANDMVNFKVELVKEQTGQVVGTFDNITYTKEYLDKYANVSYQVNCSNISPGDYYLRLVTTVEGSSEYFLGNVQNSGEGLDKRKYTRINFDGTTLPVTYSLEQNYPNPFNPTTTIRYQIPKEGMVTLKVYDILGAEVATLVNEEKIVGRYEVSFDASRLASGVYIYRLSVNDFVNVKKMVLLK